MGVSQRYDVSEKKDQKPASKIFKKPIHDKATRKVSALPELIKQSERPDGEKADTVENESVADEQTTLAAESSLADGGLFDDLFSDVDED